MSDNDSTQASGQSPEAEEAAAPVENQDAQGSGDDAAAADEGDGSGGGNNGADGADGGDNNGADGASAGAAAADEKANDADAPDAGAELDAAKAELKRTKEKVLRVAADFDNFRKRSNRDVEDARRRGKQSSVKDLLPVFDNLERAVSQVDENTDAKSMSDGIRMVLKQFIDTLGRMGIERVEAVGKPFDPMVHDSIQHEPSTEIDAVSKGAPAEPPPADAADASADEGNEEASGEEDSPNNSDAAASEAPADSGDDGNGGDADTDA
jgi:molecular chaperone GrpE